MKIVLLLLLALSSYSAESWIDLDTNEIAVVKTYLAKLVALGEEGNVAEYLSVKYGDKFDKLDDDKKQKMISKVKGDFANDLEKIKNASKSSTMSWQIKPSILQVQFSALSNSTDTVVVIAKGADRMIVLGYKTSYKSP